MVNASIYQAEGRHGMALLSAGLAAPIVGNVALLAKYGWLLGKGGKAGTEAAELAGKAGGEAAEAGKHVPAPGGTAGELVNGLNSTIPNSQKGRGLFGLFSWVKPTGQVDDALRESYIAVANSTQFANDLIKYNRFAKWLGQTPSANIDDIIKALENDTTFAKTSHALSAIFIKGEHAASTTFWIQGKVITPYGRRVGRHELLHLGAALKGQKDTYLHEIAVQAASTPENLIIGGSILVGIGTPVAYNLYMLYLGK